MPSIYLWANIKNFKVYVGQTKNSSSKRMKQHLYDFGRVQKGLIRSNALYDAMLEFGQSSFEFREIFYVFKREDLNFYEKLFVSYFDSCKNGYNRTGGGSGDSECSQYTKELRSAITSELWASDWFKQKMMVTLGSEEKRKERSVIAKRLWSDPKYVANRKRGHLKSVNTDNYKQKQSEARKKLWVNPEFRAKVIKNQNIGKSTPEFKAKRSELTKRMVDEGKFTSKKKCYCNGIEYASQKEALIALNIGQKRFYTLLESGVIKYL